MKYQISTCQVVSNERSDKLKLFVILQCFNYFKCLNKRLFSNNVPSPLVTSWAYECQGKPL